MSKLLKSRKFLLLLLDTVISLVSGAIGLLAAPEQAEQVLYFIGLLQPVFVAIIVVISVEDAAALKAGSHPNQVG